MSGTYSGDDIREVMTLRLVHRSRFYNHKGIEEYNQTELKFEKWTEYDFKSYPNYPANFIDNYQSGENYEYCYNMTNNSIAGSDENPNIYEYLAFLLDTWPDVQWLSISEELGDVSVEVIAYV